MSTRRYGTNALRIGLFALLLAACSEDGKRIPADGVELQRVATLMLHVADSGAGQAHVCLALRRSRDAGAWIGETVQTWWKLAQGQQFNVNGIRMLATDGAPAAVRWPRPYCASVEAGSDYLLEWQDPARSLAATATLAALPAPALHLHPRQGEQWLLRWRPDTGHPAHTHIGTPAADPPLPANALHAGSPLQGAAPVADARGEIPLRIHPQTRAVQVRLVRERHMQHALLGFPATQVTLRQDITQWLDVPAAAPSPPTFPAHSPEVP